MAGIVTIKVFPGVLDKLRVKILQVLKIVLWKGFKKFICWYAVTQ